MGRGGGGGGGGGGNGLLIGLTDALMIVVVSFIYWSLMRSWVIKISVVLWSMSERGRRLPGLSPFIVIIRENVLLVDTESIPFLRVN